jgi:hypothetical protein
MGPWHHLDHVRLQGYSPPHDTLSHASVTGRNNKSIVSQQSILKALTECRATDAGRRAAATHGTRDRYKSFFLIFLIDSYKKSRPRPYRIVDTSRGDAIIC